MIGIGLVTCDRPSYAAQAAGAIRRHLMHTHTADVFHSVHDEPPGHPGNRGVGRCKNELFRSLLEAGCDWIFISEDDVVVDSPMAVTGYIRAAEASGWDHLMFHGHGPHNPISVGVGGDYIKLWPNYVGAWCLYSRRALETCGLMDEQFHNAWEHVEHSLRLAQAGFTAPWRGAADALGSEAWLHEQPGAIEASVLRQDPEWVLKSLRGREHWRATYPDTFAQVFGSAELSASSALA